MGLGLGSTSGSFCLHLPLLCIFLNIFYCYTDFIMLADYRQGKSWHQFCAVSYGVQHSSNSVWTGPCQYYPGMYLNICVVSKIWCFSLVVFTNRWGTIPHLPCMPSCHAQWQLYVLTMNHISLLLLPENQIWICQLFRFLLRVIHVTVSHTCNFVRDLVTWHVHLFICLYFSSVHSCWVAVSSKYRVIRE